MVLHPGGLEGIFCHQTDRPITRGEGRRRLVRGGNFLHTQILVHLHAKYKTHFHMKGFALGLTLKQRRKASHKLSIQMSPSGAGGRQLIGRGNGKRKWVSQLTVKRTEEEIVVFGCTDCFNKALTNF